MFFKKKTKKEQPSEFAQGLANQYLMSFRNVSIEKMDDLSEDLIEMAEMCLKKYDMASYKCLLNAAKETSYLYHGSKYSNELVEDIIRRLI